MNDMPETKVIAGLTAPSRAAQVSIVDATKQQVGHWIKGRVWAVAKESIA
jgi:hypothetical protein